MDEEEETEVGFKMGTDDDEPLEPLDLPEEITDLDDDPDNRYH